MNDGWRRRTGVEDTGTCMGGELWIEAAKHGDLLLPLANRSCPAKTGEGG
jgi:hypothetical protein